MFSCPCFLKDFPFHWPSPFHTSSWGVIRDSHNKKQSLGGCKIISSDFFLNPTLTGQAPFHVRLRGILSGVVGLC